MQQESRRRRSKQPAIPDLNENDNLRTPSWIINDKESTPNPKLIESYIVNRPEEIEIEMKSRKSPSITNSFHETEENKSPEFNKGQFKIDKTPEPEITKNPKFSDLYNKKDSTNTDNNNNNLKKELGYEIDMVLITGGNGYLGSHIVFYLLECGYRCRVTVHDKKDIKSWSHLERFPNADLENFLEVVECKLEDKKSWSKVMKGCQAIYHVASPNPWKIPKIDHEVIYPAVEGTVAILEAAIENGIERVIITSCICTIKGSTYKFSYNEENWGNIDDGTAVEKSKYFAERTANYISERNPGKLKMTIFNPGFLQGPTLQDHCNSNSCKFFKRLMSDYTDSLYHVHVPICDVRDCALAHIKAIKDPVTFGERYIVAEGSKWFLDMARILQREYGSYGYIFPTKTLGIIPLKLISFVDDNVKSIVPFYGKQTFFSNDKIRKDQLVFFRDADETLIDMAESFIEKGFIEDKTRTGLYDGMAMANGEDSEGDDKVKDLDLGDLSGNGHGNSDKSINLDMSSQQLLSNKKMDMKNFQNDLKDNDKTKMFGSDSGKKKLAIEEMDQDLEKEKKASPDKKMVVKHAFEIERDSPATQKEKLFGKKSGRDEYDYKKLN